jgi:small conductance mechanosensitive channel
VATGDYWGVYRDTQEVVKLAFDAAGISIPCPQREIRVHQVS